SVPDREVANRRITCRSLGVGGRYRAVTPGAPRRARVAADASRGEHETSPTRAGAGAGRLEPAACGHEVLDVRPGGYPARARRVPSQVRGDLIARSAKTFYRGNRPQPGVAPVNSRHRRARCGVSAPGIT